MNELRKETYEMPHLVTADHGMIPPHVLIMEDDASVAKGLEMVLREDGYDVNWAGTGELALELFKRKRYDVLVADLRLPGISGMDVIREIKQSKPKTEVIVITGYGTAATAVEAMKLGVRDFLPKPFTEDQIKTAVHEALGEQREPSTEAKTDLSPEEAALIQKREVMAVLNRTAEDRDFWRALMQEGSKALEDYPISMQAKAAIVSGDLKWINENIGELTQKQLMFIYKAVEREAW